MTLTTWVLVNRVYMRSHVTKVTEVKGNVTQFMGGKFLKSKLQRSIVIIPSKVVPQASGVVVAVAVPVVDAETPLMHINAKGQLHT